MTTFARITSMVLVGLLPWAAPCDELKLQVTEASKADGVSASIQGELGEKTVQLVGADGPVFEITLRKTIPLKEMPEEPRTALKQIAQGTLLGVFVAHRDERDYRDDSIYEGVYTMRFALQPQDGDHLGTAEFPYFALLVPASADTEVDGLQGYDAVTEASAEDTATAHPVVVSLRPGESSEAVDPTLEEPLEDHKSVLLSVPATTPDGESTTLTFQLVYKGLGHL